MCPRQPQYRPCQPVDRFPRTAKGNPDRDPGLLRRHRLAEDHDSWWQPSTSTESVTPITITITIAAMILATPSNGVVGMAPSATTAAIRQSTAAWSTSVSFPPHFTPRHENVSVGGSLCGGCDRECRVDQASSRSSQTLGR